MSKPTVAEFRSYEKNWEPAAQKILKDAGQPVCSPFVNPSQLDGVPDDTCFVTYEPAATNPDIRAFRDNPAFDTGTSSDPAGFSGVLVVTRRIPLGDMPPKAGDIMPCYVRLCEELGKIRAALLDSNQPFKDLLPWYDVQLITEQQPQRGIDGPRQGNQATLRFGIQWLPAEDAW